jgi:hypothetical protein
MKIKSWKEYNESISGTELIGQHMGPNYPEQNLPTTLSQSDTEIAEGCDGNLYTYDDYESLYQDYLKKGGGPLHGFTKQNLDTVLSFSD